MSTFRLVFKYIIESSLGCSTCSCSCGFVGCALSVCLSVCLSVTLGSLAFLFTLHYYVLLLVCLPSS